MSDIIDDELWDDWPKVDWIAVLAAVGVVASVVAIALAKWVL